ncbi:MAG: hypothetical protein GX817_06740, partial [Elusimicrobia bacterium]|nr:hypothetical protein [Elusimicrobiota bacterium]
MKKIKTKVLIFALACFLLFVLSELLLSLAGRIYLQRRAQSPKPESTTATSILCIGDSNTWGMGAPDAYSYPAQLSRLLNDDRPEKIEVINLGIMAGTSFKVSALVSQWIEDYQPDFSFIMVGPSDYWNWRDSNYYLFSDKWSSGVLRFFSRTQRLKTVRFLTLLSKNIKDKSKSGSYANSSAIPEGRPLYKELPFTSLPLSSADEVLLSESVELIHAGKISTARDKLEFLKQQYPDNPALLAMLGSTYTTHPDDYAHAIEYFEKTIQLCPEDFGANKQLVQLYHSQGMKDKSSELLVKMRKRFPEKKKEIRILSKRIPYLEPDPEILSKALFENLSKTVESLFDSGSQVVLMNHAAEYPTFVKKAYEKIRDKYDID